MKSVLFGAALFLAASFYQSIQAQSTTGGQSGGSTASTGSGYLTGGRRPATSKAASMTIADEGATRSYMYVPPSQRKNGASTQAGTSQQKSSSTAARKASVKTKTTVKKRLSTKARP
ncbi:hypothetical protein HNV11_12300 [Spirosoma taeanense]|uniref:Uncharacterized protein n=1 Tax=Spirosoma taeanense TaxID=2735870 RepID=A0A6M5Y9Z5_9BACT|nr:hypothetical protein [Spirosoma taeanense]QJW90100.1 hypothetical protein HNV11_12300 [Spirosoma taeanense]